MDTKRQVLSALNINQSQLARLLGITRGAVSQWPNDEPIPELQWLRLLSKRPDYRPAIGPLPAAPDPDYRTALPSAVAIPEAKQAA